MGEKYSNVTELMSPKGCAKCDNTGYKGRTVISEVLPLDPALDNLIAISVTKKEILTHCRSRGFLTMDEDGIEKIIAGLIDVQELMRVVDLTQRF